MSAATINSKGQITLPKSVRDRLGVGAGDRVEFVETQAGFLVLPATRDLRSIRGLLPKRKHAVSIEEMNEAVRRMGRVGRTSWSASPTTSSFAT